VSDLHTVTDYDECRIGEGLELHVQGTGFVPFPATPGPPPRPGTAKEGPVQ
jgi:hypothetical protein